MRKFIDDHFEPILIAGLVVVLMVCGTVLAVWHGAKGDDWFVETLESIRELAAMLVGALVMSKRKRPTSPTKDTDVKELKEFD